MHGQKRSQISHCAHHLDNQDRSPSPSQEKRGKLTVDWFDFLSKSHSELDYNSIFGRRVTHTVIIQDGVVSRINRNFDPQGALPAVRMCNNRRQLLCMVLLIWWLFFCVSSNMYVTSNRAHLTVTQISIDLDRHKKTGADWIDSTILSNWACNILQKKVAEKWPF